MIHVDRNRIDKNGNLIKPSAQWFVLSNAAKDKIIEEVNNGNSPLIVETTYKSNDVRMALEQLFEFKCAYCGCEVSSTEWEVEHFRPKGKVAENQNHPGYYWLSYTWDNLYLSCTYCNQIRIDKPLYGDHSIARTDGKGSQFPLEKEKERAFCPEDNISRESPLLLDPCIDKPEEHFSYDPLGNIIAINQSVRGDATIRICHLDRRRLTKARKKVINDIARLLELRQNFDLSGLFGEALILNDIIYENYIKIGSQYAGAARCVFEKPDEFGIS